MSEEPRKFKRNRLVIVCTNCRRRKIRCNKASPCANCIASKNTATCAYDTPVDRKPGAEYTMKLDLKVDPLQRPQKRARPQHLPHPVASSSLESVGNYMPLALAVTPKTELQVLKERLEQIERSLLSSDRASASGRSNSLGSTRTSALANSNENGNGSSSGNLNGNPNGNPNGNQSGNQSGNANGNSAPYSSGSYNLGSYSGPSSSYSGPSGSFSGNSYPGNNFPGNNFPGSNMPSSNGSNVPGSFGSGPSPFSSGSFADPARSYNRPGFSPLARPGPQAMPPPAMPSAVFGQPLARPSNGLFLAMPPVQPVQPAPAQNPPHLLTPQYYSTPTPPACGYVNILNPVLAECSQQLPMDGKPRDQGLPPLPLSSAPSAPSLDSTPLTLDGKLYGADPLCTPEYLMVGENPYGDARDTINFYEHYDSLHAKDDLRRINFGPFAWLSLMRRDRGLHLVWEHIKEKKENSLAHVFAQNSLDLSHETQQALLHCGPQFEKRALETDGIEEIIPYSSILEEREQRKLAFCGHAEEPKPKLPDSLPPPSTKAPQKALLRLLYYDLQIERQLDAIERIKLILPKRKVMWMLLRRFFDVLYMYMPYLDQQWFTEDLERIFGPIDYDDESIPQPKIDRKLDLATVGILLVILRLAYLSLMLNNTLLTESLLNSNDPSPKIQERKYLLQNPVSIHTVNVAELCFDQFKITRRSNFLLLQFGVFLRVYHIYAPEDGDGADGGDLQVFSAVLTQMAYQLGLNREPTSSNLRMNNLSRKLWSFVSFADMHQAYCFGNPMLIDSRFSDTSFPHHCVGGENLIEHSRDKTMLDRYQSCQLVFPYIQNLLLLTLDVNLRVGLPQIMLIMSQLEVRWYKLYGTMADCVPLVARDEDTVMDRNFKVKVYMLIKMFIMTVYFHVYLYYEDKNTDMAFFYYKKCLLILTSDVMPHYPSVLRNSEVVSDMWINPTLEMFIHKANMVYLLGIIRINFVIYHLRENENHLILCSNDQRYMAYFQRLCQALSCLTRAAEYTISAISKLSKRYYYAWRITKSQTVLLKNITSTEFYANNYHLALDLYRNRYTSVQLQELIILCENTLKSFRNSEFSTFGFSHKADTQLTSTTTGTTPAANVEPSPPDRVTDLETDKLWLDILSWKHDITNYYEPEAASPAGSVMGKSSAPSSNREAQTPKFPAEMSTKLDIFSDMPFTEFYDV